MMSILNDFSCAALVRLSTARLFTAIGQKVFEPRVKVASSMAEAIQMATSVEWMNVRLEARGILSRALSKEHRHAYEEWNVVVDEIDESLSTMVQKASLIQEVHDVLMANAKQDFVQFVLESHFSPLIRSVFFSELIAWYESGHVPCGWEGDYPGGFLMVF